MVELTLHSSGCRTARLLIRLLDVPVGVLAALSFVTSLTKGKVYLVAALLAWLCIYRSTYGTDRKWRKLFSKGQPDPEQTDGLSYEFDMDGVRVTSDSGMSVHAWDETEGYGNYGHYAYFQFADQSCILLDRARMSAKKLRDIMRLCEKAGVRRRDL